MYLLGQDRSHDRMVERPETVGYVALDEPGRAPPSGTDALQRGVTAPARTETVGVAGELRLVIRLQQQADHFLQQLVRPRRQVQRTLLAGMSFLVDEHTSCWGPPVTLMAERIDDRLDLAQIGRAHV